MDGLSKSTKLVPHYGFHDVLQFCAIFLCPVWACSTKSVLNKCCKNKGYLLSWLKPSDMYVSRSKDAIPYVFDACLPEGNLQVPGSVYCAAHWGVLGLGPSCCVLTQERDLDLGWAPRWGQVTGQAPGMDLGGTFHQMGRWVWTCTR